MCLLFELENKACIHRVSGLVGVWLPNQQHNNYCNKYEFTTTASGGTIDSFGWKLGTALMVVFW